MSFIHRVGLGLTAHNLHTLNQHNRETMDNFRRRSRTKNGGDNQEVAEEQEASIIDNEIILQDSESQWDDLAEVPFSGNTPPEEIALKTYEKAEENPQQKPDSEAIEHLLSEINMFTPKDGRPIHASSPNEIVQQLASQNRYGTIGIHYKDLKNVGAKINPNHLISKLAITSTEDPHATIIAHNLTTLMEDGANIDTSKLIQRLQKSRNSDCIIENLDQFIQAGAKIDIDNVIESTLHENPQGNKLVADNLEELLAAGAHIDVKQFAKDLENQGSYIAIANNLSKLIAHGAEINPNRIIKGLKKNHGKEFIANNIDQFVDAGAKINPKKMARDLMRDNYAYAVAYNIDKFVNLGAEIDANELVDTLFNENQFGRAMQVGQNVTNSLERLVTHGADFYKITEKLINNNSGLFKKNIDKFVKLSGNADEFATKVKQLIDASPKAYLYYDKEDLFKNISKAAAELNK